MEGHAAVAGLHLDVLHLTQHLSRGVLHIDVPLGVVHQVLEGVGRAVADDIAHALSAVGIDEFDEHVLESSVVAACRQVHFEGIHLAGQGQDGHIFPAGSLLIEVDAGGWDEDHELFLDAVEDIVAEGGRHGGIAADTGQTGAITERIVFDVRDAGWQRDGSQRGIVLKTPRGNGSSSGAAAEVYHGEGIARHVADVVVADFAIHNQGLNGVGASAGDIVDGTGEVALLECIYDEFTRLGIPRVGAGILRTGGVVFKDSHQFCVDVGHGEVVVPIGAYNLALILPMLEDIVRIGVGIQG